MDIRPALFIGLGSTGVRIINDFRRLMFEQFSKAGLPIFGYIGMETDGTFSVSGPNLPDEYSLSHYEKINMVPLTIAGKTAVDPLLDDKSPSFSKDLTRWLDQSLLKGTFAIKTGAGNVRMLGRLGLWKNWPSVKAKLQEKHAEILGHQATTETLNILRAKLPGLKTAPQVKSGYDIYLLSTLCGGTCSGSILDMAFQIKNLFGLGNIFGQNASDPRFHAILTILDHVLAGNAGLEPNAANCWAALKELDYYMDEETEYDYAMPGDPPIAKPINDPPLSCIYLVGRTNMMGTFFPGAPGAFDDSQINKMVALKLFNNSFMGLGSEIGKRVVNQAALTAAGINERNNNLHGRCMVSFGVSSLWYPKYRIAEVFSLKQAGEFCRSLVDEANPARQFILENLINHIWGKVWTGIQQLALNAPGITKASTTIDKTLSKLDGFAEKIEGSNLESYLKNFPPESVGSLGQRLSEGGDIWAQISAMSVDADKFIRDTLEKWITKKLGAIDNLDPSFQGDQERIENYGEMRWLLEKLKIHLSQRAAVGNAGAKDFIFKAAYTPDQLKIPEPSFMDKLTGKDKDMMEEYNGKKQETIDNYKKSVREHLKRVVELFLQPNLEKWIDEVLNEHIKKIDKIIMNINNIAGELDENCKAVKQAGSNETENMLEIGMRGAGKLDMRIEELQQVFKNQSDANRMLVIQKILQDWEEGGNAKTWTALFLEDKKIVANRIKTPFFRWALDTTTGTLTDLIAIAQDEFAGDPLPLQHHLEKSYPYVAMHGGYVRFLIQDSAKIDHLLGPGKVKSLKQFIDRLDQKFTLAISTESPLETLISFYREEPPFTIDDLAAKKHFEVAYDRLEKSGSILHIHNKGDKEFDKSGIFEFRKIKREYDIVQWLYPSEAFEKAGEGIWVLKYQHAELKKIKVEKAYDQSDPKEGEKFCHILAQDDGKYARHEFRKKVLEVLCKRTREKVDEEWAGLITKWMGEKVDQNEIDKREEAFTRLLNTAFPGTDAQPASNVKPLRSV